MDTTETRSAVNAATATASELGLTVEDATVLHNSNRIAVRLLPCAVLARVAPLAYLADADFEVEVARRLAETGAPVAGLEPRVKPRAYVRDGFAITFWTYYEPDSSRAPTPAEYARALEQLHAGMRGIELAAPHFTDRVAEAQDLVDAPARTPALADADRRFLSNVLRNLREAVVQRGAPEQLLHGEPHPGNLLSTKAGLLFIDLQTCCNGPVEFDIAHAPEDVGECYAGADRGLLDECRVLSLAMVAAWRWDRDDQFPDGLRMGTDLLNWLRTAAARYG